MFKKSKLHLLLSNVNYTYSGDQIVNFIIKYTVMTCVLINSNWNYYTYNNVFFNVYNIDKKKF